MTFAERMEADLDALFNPDEFAKLATYTHRAGGSELIAMLWEGEADTSTGDGIAENPATAVVRKGDIPDPDYGDRITISGRTWDVVRRAGEDEHVFLLALSENRRPEIG